MKKIKTHGAKNEVLKLHRTKMYLTQKRKKKKKE
jgi:hypothetical protein